ncbi:LytTR family DNA-binding domain-containing protein [Erythrobacter sp.]|uniref:LytR/AlgR family response regulator transcription factor n=1 Tax=Erythrobacter sp. TaxID=1042 RepID=UPI001AFE964F|nr:LytTR family DNA-binding domain-containing protein [Erythrobacter sp.]MBO6525993.1 LytTR family transcriptional regulator [Erythrobacter sp.]MBO6530658.1 LytTR family transcriptional regulator [Erythrobacter sp.]
MTSLRPPLAIAIGLLLVAATLYFTLFTVFQGSAVTAALLATLANIVPLALLGAGVRVMIRMIPPRLGLPTLLALHAAGALVFALVWFWLLMVALGVLDGENAVTFSVAPFTGPAAAWQLKQGLAFYAMFAVLAHWELALQALPRRTDATENAEPARQFVKDGDETVPLDPARVFYFSGAGDHAQMHALGGTRLLRTTLSDLEATLGERFMRIHRSLLVNLDKVERMEPAGGGRLALHLANGDTLTASRNGSKAIRSRTL